MNMKKVIAFSGSNSSKSINQKLVKIAAEQVTQFEAEVIDLRNYESPLYGVDLEREEGIPQSIIKLKEKLREADGYIISTPEHNGSMPAFFKNTIDWLSRHEKKVFDDKPVLFLSTSPGARGARSALEHLTNIMPYRGATVVGSYSLGSFNDKFVDGQLESTSLSELKSKVQELEKSILDVEVV